MKNSAWIITLICAFAMQFLTRGWWQSVLACWLLGVVYITTKLVTQRDARRETPGLDTRSR